MPKRRLSASEFTASAVAAAVATATAAAATVAATREKNWLCGVCKDIYEKPATVPCGHTFCLDCIKRALVVKEECPVCRSSVRRTLVLAVNTVIQEVVADNAGPMFLARQAEKADAFFIALEALDPEAAISAFSPATTDLRRFVGDTPLLQTPLLWACERAHGDDAAAWNDLIMRLLSAGANVHACDSLGHSPLYFAAAGGGETMALTIIPALFDRGARDASAPAALLSRTWLSLSNTNRYSLDRSLLPLVEDASYALVTDEKKRTDLARLLKNGFDHTATALLDQNVRLAPLPMMLQWAAAGDCATFTRKLLAAGIVQVDHVFENGQTALNIACLFGQEKTALALLDCGASNFRHDEYLRTPLTSARKNQMASVESAILSKGCEW